VSVAWATLEWICTQILARTLFATHYHELTRLSGSIPLLANAHMAVETGAENGRKTGMQNAEFRFLYILKEGAANESFGIHVAKLAGLPKSVVDRAWKVLDELEQTSIASNNSSLTPDTQQLSFFSLGAPGPQLAAVPAEPHPVLTEIEKLNPNEMTPMQALTTLAKLQEMSRESDSASSSKQNR
jgi:DNA mismatch repair protein MutS